MSELQGSMQALKLCANQVGCFRTTDKYEVRTPITGQIPVGGSQQLHWYHGAVRAYTLCAGNHVIVDWPAPSKG